MTIRLLELLYFMAPAYLANMAPPFARYWPGWNRPILVSTVLTLVVISLLYYVLLAVREGRAAAT